MAATLRVRLPAGVPDAIRELAAQQWENPVRFTETVQARGGRVAWQGLGVDGAGLHDAKSAQISGSIRVGGTEVVGLAESRMRKLRGNSMAMIFQDALAALHPFYRVGDQLGTGVGRPVTGGATRQISVARGLAALARLVSVKPSRKIAYSLPPFHPPGCRATADRSSPRCACRSRASKTASR